MRHRGFRRQRDSAVAAGGMGDAQGRYGAGLYVLTGCSVHLPSRC